MNKTDWMILVEGAYFPNTAEGHRQAARYVRSLGPTFYDDARGLEAEATRLEHEAKLKRRVIIVVVGSLVGTVLGNLLWRDNPNYSVWTGWLKQWVGF